MAIHRKLNLKGSQHDHREHHSSQGSPLSGTCGREESSKQVAWVEEAGHEALRQEDSKSSLYPLHGRPICLEYLVRRIGQRDLLQ